MKNVLFIVLFLLSVGFFSCQESDIRFESDFEHSFDQWTKFKTEHNNTYFFVVRNESWVGAAWETTITIGNGNVVARSFRFISTQGLHIPQEAQTWSENSNEIGTHSVGAQPQTLDQIYEKARNEWLLKRENAKTYFEAKNNGLLSSCGYVENGCMDDCFTGIRISNIGVIDKK